MRDWKAQVPACVSSSREVAVGELFTEIFLYCAPLLKFTPPEPFRETLSPDSERVRLAVPLLRRYYDEAARANLRAFSAVNWGRIIVSVILGMRLSFPIRGLCWDDAHARAEIRLDEFLGALCDSVPSPQGTDDRRTNDRAMDIGTASRLIFDVVRKKYDDGLERQARSEEAARMTCPVLDGSLDEYLHMWDGEPVGTIATGDSIASSSDHPGLAFVPGIWSGEPCGVPSSGDGGTGPQVYHDLWSTMTTLWPESEADSL